MLVLNFDRPLERGEIDGDLIERVREELPGVLNWAMEGAKRLAQRGYFLPPPGHHEAVLGMQFGTDPVALFAHLAVEAAPGDRQGVTTERLRAALKAFAETRGLDTDGWNEVTHMKRLADFLKKLYGAERAARDGRPFYRFVKLRAEQG
jgi:putative DNA primase/helicase